MPLILPSEPRMNKSLRAFFFLFTFFLSICMTLLIGFNKVDLHLALTQYYIDTISAHTICDPFYYFASEFGYYIPMAIAIIIAIFHLGNGIYFASTQIVSIGIIYLLKLLFYTPRPIQYFEEIMPDITLHSVDGMTLNMSSSFPSFHACAVFACMFSLTFILRNYSWLYSLLFFSIAIIVAYAQIYLSQNFLSDVLFGAIIGVSISALCAWLYTKKSYKWYNYSIIKKSL